LNRHSEHTYWLTEVHGSSDQLRKIKVPDPAPDSKLAQDPELAPDPKLASVPEQALDPELAPEGSRSSDHLREIKVPNPAPNPELAPDLELALTPGLGLELRHNIHKMLLNEKKYSFHDFWLFFEIML
jgi:hypothetical protein